MKFTVHLLTVAETFEGVEAKDEATAIEQCRGKATVLAAFDCNEVTSWLACEEEGN